MEFGEGEEIILLADEFGSSSSSSSFSSVHFCRICLEEEDEKSSSMETPCSCSGTLKFAHRRCIQRWCDEKGNNVCEICLQKFEPGYVVTLPPPTKPHLVDVVVSIRRSLEVTRHNHEPESHTVLFIRSSEPEREYIVSSQAYDRSMTLCRLIVLMFTISLLVRQVFVLLFENAEDYAFSLATVFILRAVGILLPFCLLMRLITVIQNAQKTSVSCKFLLLKSVNFL
ncbi:hypothetical protein IEQ34_010059 [Dendrobium chrysotoxum]|uniref:RING-CH-type domain-containing protein n=1 Tax=Dendrobium chrysotoxum TaxID=161865 RepID=A0AAV7H422_DENCH|nr:hypothetical protein IEQ34_010059 [Dendrobium chrysotoxum]